MELIMGYWTRGRNPKGERTLSSFRGQELVRELNDLKMEDINQMNVGERLVYLGQKRTKQWAYEITNIDIDRRDKFYFTLNKLTPTGKVSKAQNAKFHIYMDDLKWSSYKYYDGVIDEIEDYLEHTKEYYVSGENRDSQRQRVYDSECAVKRILGDIQKFDSLYEANKFLQDTINSEKFKNKFPDFSHDVSIDLNNHLKSKAVARYRTSEILISGDSKEWGLSIWVIIHELAHFTAQGSMHNAPFTTHYADMIEWFDEEKAKALRNQYEMRSVEY